MRNNNEKYICKICSPFIIFDIHTPNNLNFNKIRNNISTELF